MPDHSFSKEIFPNIQSKSPLAQLETISSCCIASYLGEETNTCLTTTSFQVVVESNCEFKHGGFTCSVHGEKQIGPLGQWAND